MALLCKSCTKYKTAAEFEHPSTGKQGKTCAQCIMRKSAAARRPADDVATTLTVHASRLDDHETRLCGLECVEWTSSRADVAEWMELEAACQSDIAQGRQPSLDARRGKEIDCSS